MSQRELKKLAKLIFQLTRREVWLGGKTEVDHAYHSRKVKGWPSDMEQPKWSSDITWTLSPEIELGGHKMRVCVSSNASRYSRDSPYSCRVRVFTDGKLVYPGGWYDQKDWWLFAGKFPSWAVRIATLERRDGGKTGPVDSRDLLIAEAKERLEVPQSAKPKKLLTDNDDPAAIAAIAEVEALTRKVAARKAAERQ
jgi:hypothetical protein